MMNTLLTFFESAASWLPTLATSISTIIGFALYYKANKRIKDAEADKAAVEVERAHAEMVSAEVARLHSQLDNMQVLIKNLSEMEQSHTKRMSDLNNTIDSLIDRNRELSQRLAASQDNVTQLTAKLGVAERRIDYLNTWRCERPDCQDPRGAKPPRTKLRGLKYAPPAEA